MRKISILALLLNTVLFATYYPVAKGALASLDEYVFMALVGLLTVPVALALIGSDHVAGQPVLNWQTLRSGLTLGVLSNLAFLVSIQALNHTTATNTTFLGALDGLIGAVIAAAILRQRQHALTWIAGGVSLTGAAIMILGGSSAQAGLGDLLALLGGIVYTWNVFQTDCETRRPGVRTRGLLGVMLLTEAALSLVQSLALGDWGPTLNVGISTHLPVLVYVAMVTTVLPYAVTLGLQRFVPPVTVSFIYILEPVWSAAFASLWLGERLNAAGLLAAGLILSGSVLALAASRLPVTHPILAYSQAGD